MYLSEILFQHELCSLKLVVDKIWYPSLYDFTKDKLSFVCTLCVNVCTRTVSVCLHTYYRSLHPAEDFIDVQCSTVCECAVCTVYVYTLTTGPCTLLEILQVYRHFLSGNTVEA